MLTTKVEEVSKPGVESALDAIGRGLGEKGGVPDYQMLKIGLNSNETALIPGLTLRASICCWVSRSSMSKME